MNVGPLYRRAVTNHGRSIPANPTHQMSTSGGYDGYCQGVVERQGVEGFSFFPRCMGFQRVQPAAVTPIAQIVATLPSSLQSSMVSFKDNR